MEDADIVATVKDTHRLKALGTLAKFPDMDVHRLKERLFQGLIYEIEMFALEYPDGIPDDVLAANMDSAEVVRLIKPFLDELCAVCRELYESGETYGVAGDNLGTYFIWGPKEDAEVMLEGYYGPVGIEKMKAMHDSCTAAVEAVCDYVENYEAEPGQYKFSINTDKTGNVAESLTLAYRIPVGDEYEIDSFTLRGASGEGEVVYDAMYGGFVLTRGSQLLTRVDGSYNFVVEQIGESDLPVDVKPEELFQ